MDILEKKESLFKESVEKLLQFAQSKGASQAEVSLIAGRGFNLTVRNEEIETIEHNEDQNLHVVVYVGQQKGAASTTDLSEKSLFETVEAALQIATFTLPDPCAGLPDPSTLARSWPSVDLYHPWGITVAEGIRLAQDIEAYALADARISNSEGANLNTYAGLNVYGNSEGFLASTYASEHGLSLSLIAGASDAMQRDFSFSEARDYRDLWAPEKISKDAVLRTVRRLDPRKIKTQSLPVIFEAEVAGGLIAHYLKAVSGGALYRRSSFLLDSLNTQVFPDWFWLYEDPFIPKALGSTPFDAEGVAVKPQYLVSDGKVKTYLLNTYTARKLGMKTTGHAGGTYNISVSHDKKTRFKDLVRTMNRGLIVTEVMGQGVNLITGDYSRGASGFWVENGEIQYPVQEITIAGHLKDMFRGIQNISNDIESRGRIHSGSILIDQMKVAGH